jgi:hypothetical protein
MPLKTRIFNFLSLVRGTTKQRRCKRIPVAQHIKPTFATRGMRAREIEVTSMADHLEFFYRTTNLETYVFGWNDTQVLSFLSSWRDGTLR